MEVPNLRTFTFAEMKIATRNFRPDTILGEGGFGRVYKGWVEEKTLNPAKTGLGMIVAVKKLSPDSMQGLEQWQVIPPVIFESRLVIQYIFPDHLEMFLEEINDLRKQLTQGSKEVENAMFTLFMC